METAFDVDSFDPKMFAGNFAIPDPSHEDGDFHGDGDITAADVDLMFAQWGLELDVVS